MTLSEIMASNKAFLTPDDVAEVLECSPQALRIQAREKPELLGFPVTVIASRTKIPRIPFLRFVGFGVSDISERNDTNRGYQND